VPVHGRLRSDQFLLRFGHVRFGRHNVQVGDHATREAFLGDPQVLGKLRQRHHCHFLQLHAPEHVVCDLLSLEGSLPTRCHESVLRCVAVARGQVLAQSLAPAIPDRLPGRDVQSLHPLRDDRDVLRSAVDRHREAHRRPLSNARVVDLKLRAAHRVGHGLPFLGRAQARLALFHVDAALHRLQGPQLRRREH
jgi:hypothetical protein